jgi:hypothetical protein
MERRPWKLARETVTLDHLSGGRLVLPVGLGTAAADAGFYKVGEQMSLRGYAQLMDECLAILAGAWSGEVFPGAPLERGRHHVVDGNPLERCEPATGAPTYQPGTAARGLMSHEVYKGKNSTGPSARLRGCRCQSLQKERLFQKRTRLTVSAAQVDQVPLLLPRVPYHLSFASRRATVIAHPAPEGAPGKGASALV